jgi:hypothetical protein
LQGAKRAAVTVCGNGVFDFAKISRKTVWKVLDKKKRYGNSKRIGSMAQYKLHLGVFCMGAVAANLALFGAFVPVIGLRVSICVSNISEIR